MKLFRQAYEQDNGLPIGYTEVEYIEGSGTQYIDTGVSASEGICTEAKFKINTITNSNQAVFGKVGVTSGSTSRYFFGIQSSSSDLFYYAFNDIYQTDKQQDTNIHTVLFDSVNNILKIDDNSWTLSGDLRTNSETIYLFGAHFKDKDNNDINNNPMSGRIYYTKIYDNGTLVRDFIPCIDPLGRACMYDLVGKKAYYNQGTGEFIVGRQIIPVEYLESTGTQYIDTNMSFDANTTTKCKFAFVDQTITAAKHLIGALSANLDARYNPVYCTSVSGVSKIRTLLNIAGSASITRDFDTNIHTIEFNTYPDKKVIYDGVFENTVESTGTSNVTINLFRRNYSGGDAYVNARIYYCQFYKQGELVRDFIPCKDENGVGFMFDRVTHTSYLNAGTGNFTYGEDAANILIQVFQHLKDFAQRLSLR